MPDKKVLIESFGNLHQMTYIAESLSDNSGRHYLGRFEGPAADLKNATRNGRKYGIKLWRNVEASDDFKEGMETHTIFGEADHPNDRLETSIKEVAIVLRKFEIRENEGIVWCSFDILDTPNGRIIKELLDYGSQIGVSSRGSGEEVNDPDGGTMIDPDTYIFVCFDAVVMPAVKSARPTVVESVDLSKTKSLVDSIKSEINEASTKQELDSIKSIIESAKLQDLDSLKESIDIKLNQLSSGDDISSKLVKDLGESATKIGKLEAKIESLNEQISADNIRVCDIKKLYSEATSNSKDLSRLLRESKRTNSELEKSLTEANDKISGFDCQLQQLRSDNCDFRTKYESLDKLSSRVLKTKHSELVDAKRKLSRYMSSVEDIKSENESLSKEVVELKKHLSESSSRSTENQLKESKLMNESGTLRRNLTESEDKNRELNSRNRKLDEQLKHYVSQVSSLKDENTRLIDAVNESKSSASKLYKENQKTIRKYLEISSVQSNLSLESIERKLPENYSVNDIDRVITELSDNISRINEMPIVLPDVSARVDESISRADPESNQTIRMLRATKIN